jgi:hypothetical protein
MIKINLNFNKMKTLTGYLMLYAVIFVLNIFKVISISWSVMVWALAAPFLLFGILTFATIMIVVFYKDKIMTNDILQSIITSKKNEIAQLEEQLNKSQD